MLTHIIDNLKDGFGYSSYEELRKNSASFKQGKQDFIDGKVKIDPQNCYWVSKLVSKRYFDTLNQRDYYCFGEYGVGKEKQIKIGFLAGNIPISCEECSEEEKRQIHNYRKMYNIYPLPFSVEEEKQKQEFNQFKEELPEDELKDFNIMFGNN